MDILKLFTKCFPQFEYYLTPKYPKKVSSITIYFINIKNNNLCGICLEKSNKNTRIKTRCNHSYHIFCIEKWCNDVNNCPLCRTNNPLDYIIN